MLASKKGQFKNRTIVVTMKAMTTVVAINTTNPSINLLFICSLNARVNYLKQDPHVYVSILYAVFLD